LTRPRSPSSVRHPQPVRQRGALCARGTGKPGRELTAGRETDAAAAKTNDVAGGGSPWRPDDPPLGRGRLNRPREPLPTSVDALPAVPAAYTTALDAALAALAPLGVVPDPGARRILDAHIRFLLAWNPAINLTAIVDPAAIARLHVADSLAVLAVIRDLPCDSLLDLGSGGGFPGIPLAALMPAMRMTLVESVGKKARFLETVVAATGLAGRVEVVGDRGESLAPGHWDVVTARAVAGLADLVELALPLLAPGGRLVAWKRGEIAGEMAAAARAARVLGGTAPAWTPHPPAVARDAGLDGHGVVVVRKTGSTPDGYPRDPGTRRRRPW
jgi:16S rRNA (guanine527-N7)-methyltransferase